MNTGQPIIETEIKAELRQKVVRMLRYEQAPSCCAYNEWHGGEGQAAEAEPVAVQIERRKRNAAEAEHTSHRMAEPAGHDGRVSGQKGQIEAALTQGHI